MLGRGCSEALRWFPTPEAAARALQNLVEGQALARRGGGALCARLFAPNTWRGQQLHPEPRMLPAAPVVVDGTRQEQTAKLVVGLAAQNRGHAGILRVIDIVVANRAAWG